MKQGESHHDEEEPLNGSTLHDEGRASFDEDHGLHSVESIQEDVSEFVQEHGLTSDTLLFTRAAALLHDVPLSSIRGITEYELVALEKEVRQKWEQPKLMYMTILMTALGAMGQGWAQTGNKFWKLVRLCL